MHLVQIQELHAQKVRTEADVRRDLARGIINHMEGVVSCLDWIGLYSPIAKKLSVWMNPPEHKSDWADCPFA